VGEAAPRGLPGHAGAGISGAVWRKRMSDHVTAGLLDEVVRRIVKTAHPRRIILFGSAAKGQMGPNSDLDILVVMPDGVHRRETAQDLYRALLGVGFATDILVVTESDIRDYGKNPSLVLCPALEDGKEIFREGA